MDVNDTTLASDMPRLCLGAVAALLSIFGYKRCTGLPCDDERCPRPAFQIGSISRFPGAQLSAILSP
jgi:hypothetical protein